MNRSRAASKSSDDIINELFVSLNLPDSEKNLGKSKLGNRNKGSLDSKDSVDEVNDSETSSSDSTDQEIDKLLEEITDVTDKNIKVEDTSFELTSKDKKKKKKKLKKSNSTKSKHKKKKSHKVKGLSSESDRETKSKKYNSPISAKVASDTEKSDIGKKGKRRKSLSRSRSRSRSYSGRKLKDSRSRSKGKSYHNSSAKYKHQSHSRSSSDSDLPRKLNKKTARDSNRSLSRSFSPNSKKDLKHQSKSPSKKDTIEKPLNISEKISTSLDKHALAAKLKLLDSNSESAEHIPSNSEPISDISNNKTNKIMSKGTNTQAASADKSSSKLNNSTDSAKKIEVKDEGKKPIVIKSLKDSSVLQQAEEAQNKSKDDENHIESNVEKCEYSKAKSLNNKQSPTNEFSTSKSGDKTDNSKEKDVKKEAVKEESKGLGEENLLTAFKKARKESANSEKKDKKPDYKKTDKSRSRSRSLRRSTSKTRRHSRSRSRKRSRSISKSRAKRRRSRSISKPRDKYKKRSRSRDKFRRKSRSRSRSRRSISRNRYRGSKRSRSRSGSRSRKYDKNRRTKRSPSKERRKSPDCVDSLRDKATRKRLLEVARKNAVYLMKNNCLPPSIEKESVRATGKSVEELTSFCRQLVSKDYSDGDSSDPSLSPDDHENFVSSTRHHHPFAVKDSKPIMMNIRNAPMIPLKTNAERLADTSKLREQFPVSSGSDHRTVESEWVPVEKDDSKEKEPVTVFPEAQMLGNIDITQLVSTRLNAMRRLQDNPTDKDAMKALTSAQKDMQNWAKSKQVPGQFTGSTGAKILSAEELTSGYQAWARKDQFRATNPVRSHFGMKMLQKMGWNPGEGLGKNKEGQVEPLVLDVKMDRKGLSANTEVTPRRAAIPLVRSLAGKHPVSALVEICLKRKWNPPEFEIVFDSGPDHKKNFQMKVHVNNQTFKSTCSASTKKIAKANAAAACLQALGLIPQHPSAPIKSKETLHTTVPQSETEAGSDGQSVQPQEGEQDQEFADGQQAGVVQYAEGAQDYAVDNSQAAQYGTEDGQAAMVQYDADGNQIMTQYDAEGNPVMVHYDADGNQVMTQYAADGTQEMPQYGVDETQAMTQYSTEDSNNLHHYSADGTHVAQYANDAMTQYAADGSVIPQYAADGTQYSANSTEAAAQYGTNGTDAMAHYSTTDTNYQQGSASQYGTDSQAQYASDPAYQQYSADNQHAYQQQSYDANGRQGSFNFPQPPRSLIHGIGDDANAAASSASNNASTNHRERDSRSNSYSNSDAYANNASYNSQMQQYYGSSYQGSQY